MRVICQVTEVELASATSPETETVEDIIRKVLPTPALPPLQAVSIPSDRDLLIQQLMATICPPTPVAQERSAAIDLETLLLNWLPVGPVIRFRQGVFFMRGFDPYNGPMPDSR